MFGRKPALTEDTTDSQSSDTRVQRRPPPRTAGVIPSVNLLSLLSPNLDTYLGTLQAFGIGFNRGSRLFVQAYVKAKQELNAGEQISSAAFRTLIQNYILEPVTRLLGPGETDPGVTEISNAITTADNEFQMPGSDNPDFYKVLINKLADLMAAPNQPREISALAQQILLLMACFGYCHAATTLHDIMKKINSAAAAAAASDNTEETSVNPPTAEAMTVATSDSPNFDIYFLFAVTLIGSVPFYSEQTQAGAKTLDHVNFMRATEALFNFYGQSVNRTGSPSANLTELFSTKLSPVLQYIVDNEQIATSYRTSAADYLAYYTLDQLRQRVESPSEPEDIKKLCQQAQTWWSRSVPPSESSNRSERELSEHGLKHLIMCMASGYNKFNILAKKFASPQAELALINFGKEQGLLIDDSKLYSNGTEPEEAVAARIETLNRMLQCSIVPTSSSLL